VRAAYLAYAPGTSGQYNLSGGSLITGTWSIGYDGAGVFNQTGLTSSILRASLPAANNSSASRRSPQQIGFIPAQRAPDTRNKRKSWTAVCVLPTPVSVPVMKRLTRLA
jgi:hypothetical protein